MSNGSITNLKWQDAIAPLLLGSAFVAVNKQFKLLDVSDPWAGCAGVVSGMSLNLIISASRSKPADEVAKGSLYSSLAIPLTLYVLQSYLICNELSEFRPYEWATPLTAAAGGVVLNYLLDVNHTWVVESGEKALKKELAAVKLELEGIKKDRSKEKKFLSDSFLDDDVGNEQGVKGGKPELEGGLEQSSFIETSVLDVKIVFGEESERKD